MAIFHLYVVFFGPHQQSTPGHLEGASLLMILVIKDDVVINIIIIICCINDPQDLCRRSSCGGQDEEHCLTVNTLVYRHSPF